jgi:hypothetical protein
MLSQSTERSDPWSLYFFEPTPDVQARLASLFREVSR